MSTLSVTCPTCNAPPGAPCKTKLGERAQIPHITRKRLSRGEEVLDKRRPALYTIPRYRLIVQYVEGRLWRYKGSTEPAISLEDYPLAKIFNWEPAREPTRRN